LKQQLKNVLPPSEGVSICNRIGMRSTTMAALIATIIIIVAEKKKGWREQGQTN